MADSTTQPAATQPTTRPKDNLKIMAQAPRFIRGKDESVEDFMARVRFAELSVFKLADGRFVDMDKDGNGKVTGDEALLVLDNPNIKLSLSDAQLAALKRIANAKKGTDQPTISLEHVQEMMRKTAPAVAKNGEEGPATRNNLPPEEFAKIRQLDVNNDGRISVGEFLYHEYKLQHPESVSPEPVSPPSTPAPVPKNPPQYPGDPRQVRPSRPSLA